MLSPSLPDEENPLADEVKSEEAKGEGDVFQSPDEENPLADSQLSHMLMWADD